MSCSQVGAVHLGGKCKWSIRDWSLITGRGGGYKTGGGAREVLRLRKGGGGKRFSHAEGGGGREKFPRFKRGVREVLPCLEGGAKSIGPAIFPFCRPPLPVINDQSLTGTVHE